MDSALRQKNTKTTWNTLRSLNIINNSKSSDLPPSLINVNAVNEYFINTPQLTKNNTQLKLLEKYNNSKMNSNITFGFTPVDKHEVIKCFNSLKSNAGWL